MRPNILLGLNADARHYAIYRTFADAPPAHPAAGHLHDSPALTLVVPVAHEVGHRQWAPEVGGDLAVPDFRALRRVVMPGAGGEITQLLVLHLIELDVEFDILVVEIAGIDRDVVGGPLSHRPPGGRGFWHPQGLPRGL